tara:strand:+ start:112 stop:984 length:873 start_codon:yes stop_codon:yes gene_type:complete
MKKLLAGVTILISISSIGQQIFNGDFENWVQQTYGDEPANWGELNTQLFSSIIPGLIDSTILKSQDSYSGNFAMELRSKTYSIFGSSDTVTAFAMLNLKNAEIDSANMIIESNLFSLSGYIKQDIIDTSDNYTVITIIVYSSSGDMTGLGTLEFDSDLINYTEFNIPIFYLDSVSGDYIEVYILAGNPDFPVPGNTMLIDNLQLNYASTTSLSEKTFSSLTVYPNPTENNITISMQNYNGVFDLQLYDLTGKRLQRSNETTLSLEDYAKGIYILKVAYDDRIEELKVIKD